jgi:hypothetical protein
LFLLTGRGFSQNFQALDFFIKILREKIRKFSYLTIFQDLNLFGAKTVVGVAGVQEFVDCIAIEGEPLRLCVRAQVAAHQWTLVPAQAVNVQDLIELEQKMLFFVFEFELYTP